MAFQLVFLWSSLQLALEKMQADKLGFQSPLLILSRGMTFVPKKTARSVEG
jgi:hypothetical protein